MAVFAGITVCCRFITREEERSGVLHLHPHNFLVSIDQLIAGFHHELKADFRLRHGDHDFMHVFHLARSKVFYAFVGLGLQVVDFAEEAAQSLLKESFPSPSTDLVNSVFAVKAPVLLIGVIAIT